MGYVVKYYIVEMVEAWSLVEHGTHTNICRKYSAYCTLSAQLIQAACEETA